MPQRGTSLCTPANVQTIAFRCQRQQYMRPHKSRDHLQKLTNALARDPYKGRLPFPFINNPSPFFRALVHFSSTGSAQTVQTCSSGLMRQHAWRRGEYKGGRTVPADGSSLEATGMQRDTSGCRDDYAYALLMGCIPGATGTIATQCSIFNTHP